MRRAAGLLLAIALTGCVPEHPAIVTAHDPWPGMLAEIDSLAATDRAPEALALVRQRLRLAAAWREPRWRVTELAAVERSLVRQVALPEPARREVAASGEQLAAARADSAADSLAAAAAHCRAAWELRRERLGASDVRTAYAALAVAQAEFALAHVLESDSLAHVARGGFALELGADHPRIADAENLMGRLVKNYTGRAGFRLARAHYDAAMRLRAAAEGPCTPQMASTMHDLANLYRLDRRDHEALALFRGALEIRRAAQGPVSEDVASSLSGMAFLCAGQGRWEEVARLEREALAASPGGSAGTRIARSGRLGLLGQALRRTGRNAEAVPALRAAVALSESLWALTSRDEGSSVNSGLSLYRELAMALAADGQAEDAFVQLARGSSRTLAWRLLGADSIDARTWRDLLPRAQRALADDEALVAWTRSATTVLAGRDPMWACVVRSRGPVRWFRLDRPFLRGQRAPGAREALWGELRASAMWPRRVSDTAPVERMAEHMGREWFAPLEPALAGVNHLVVCAPDLLAGGPLGALRDARGRWLAERFTISYTPSALLFVHARDRAGNGGAAHTRAALLVGDPAYAPGDPEHWPRLAGSREELRAIAAHWPVTTLLTGAEARLSSLRALAATGSLSGYGLLHFAAHTAIDTRAAMDAAIVLAPDTPGTQAASRLLAREVASSWTLDADLVCLAGCQSVNGLNSSSEGFLGLQAAFLAAGARSLLVSLWPVDDHATARLMESFYTHITGPLAEDDRAIALQQAQAGLRAYRAADGTHPYAHPAYWAAFALVGDPGGAQHRARRRTD